MLEGLRRILILRRQNLNEMEISYEVCYAMSRCDFIHYEIYDKHKINNKLLEKADLKVEQQLEKVQEAPITVIQ